MLIYKDYSDFSKIELKVEFDWMLNWNWIESSFENVLDVGKLLILYKPFNMHVLQ